MQLKVKDIEKIWKNGCASLVAGKDGLERIVDVYDMMEQPDIKPWLRPHLLVITTGYAIRNDKEALLKLIRDLNEVDASALAIKTRFFDEFPKEALELANELDFPIFFLNNNSGFTELVFPIMVALVEAKNQLEMETRYQLGRRDKSQLDTKLFLELQTGKITQKEEAEYRTNSLQWPETPVCLISIQLEDKSNSSLLLEFDRDSQSKMVNEIFEKYYIPCVVVCRRKQCILIVKSDVGSSVIEKAVDEIVKKTDEIQKGSAFVLITDALKDYLEITEMYAAIEEGIHIRDVQKKDWKVCYLKNLQYERIILHAAQNEEIKKFALEQLEKLEQYDRVHNSYLGETLEMLIEKNGSRKLTAEALYLHRNTMAYRMRKIEEVLECNLNDFEQLMQLRFACKIKKYL